MTSGYYALGTTLRYTNPSFYRAFICDPGAVFIPLVNNMALVTIDASPSGSNFAFNHFEGASFENPNGKTGCSGIKITADTGNPDITNNKFVNMSFKDLECGVLLDRVTDPVTYAGETRFDWNVLTNLSYIDCNYGFKSVCGSGTGNVFNTGVSLCTTAAMAWFARQCGHTIASRRRCPCW